MIYTLPVVMLSELCCAWFYAETGQNSGFCWWSFEFICKPEAKTGM